MQGSHTFRVNKFSSTCCSIRLLCHLTLLSKHEVLILTSSSKSDHCLELLFCNTSTYLDTSHNIIRKGKTKQCLATLTIKLYTCTCVYYVFLQYCRCTYTCTLLGFSFLYNVLCTYVSQQLELNSNMSGRILIVIHSLPHRVDMLMSMV